MRNFSFKKTKRIKEKIKRVLENQGRKDEIDKLIRAWKRISESEKVSLPRLMTLVTQVIQETPKDK
ncbi:MAG: hypothetical protein KAI72_04015 [Candidatus Pacebacteria bacterium]|nr:hypothetical protein [Candidatus Paceibacterota bacterium]